MPQAIAHRGYKAEHPENTMGAFRGAVKTGSHAIETDLHISRDGVVVLSHDDTLKRCFGKDEKVIDCDWSYLKTLKTLKEPSEHMPRFLDLLEYLTTPGLEDIWLLLDIKLDNDPDHIMQLIASTLAEVKPSKPWKERILLGCWASKYIPLCDQYLPGYQIAYIGWSIPYARNLLKVPGVCFNIMQQVLVGPNGKKFLQEVKAENRPIFVWTVNEPVWMKWSIKHEVDGVITDDPKKYLEVCDEYNGGKLNIPFRLCWMAFWINVLAAIGTVLAKAKLGTKVDVEMVKKRLQIISSEESGIDGDIVDED
ncbi:hypothetical protein BP5796_10983 [Coleophoma crateriformis]|uniref:GP-PDE domain-containing protein n=1 Tax=Coleophoma crateriformis TaxID=565419 RepID=A0A3D8QLU7_9HELO|nr:hypothetical protein BP5796_10983 [Coleophoma crateriformis]